MLWLQKERLKTALFPEYVDIMADRTLTEKEQSGLAVIPQFMGSHPPEGYGQGSEPGSQRFCEPGPSFEEALASAEGPEKEATLELPWHGVFDHLYQATGTAS